MYLVVADGSRPTGGHLTTALRGLGVAVGSGSRAQVSYGVRLGYDRPDVLNKNAGMSDKYQQLLTLRTAGVKVPPIYGVDTTVRFPLLARKRFHRAGKDIMPVFQEEEIPWRKAAGADFFVEHIPVQSEYRTWVFRDHHLGTYQKSMSRPEQYKKVGWNFKNGFTFNLVESESVPRGAVEMAEKSIVALDLDFGAVDIIRGKDGNFYVLEVNTAPGVESPTRQPMQALARNIKAWEDAGYPTRKQETRLTPRQTPTSGEVVRARAIRSEPTEQPRIPWRYELDGNGLTRRSPTLRTPKYFGSSLRPRSRP